MTTPWNNIEKETETVLTTIKDMTQEDVTTLLWRIANAHGIVVIQTFTAKDFDLDEWDTRATQKAVSDNYEMLDWVHDFMRRILTWG